MRILTRYVLREFLVPLVYCLVGFLGIYVLFELFDSFNRILEAKPPSRPSPPFSRGTSHPIWNG
jgi:lipopolysaccharide export LptBFGC system permease protein LptF